MADASAANVRSYLGSASAAILGEDYDEALKYAIAAQAEMAALPDFERGRISNEWDDRKIQNLIENIETRKRAADTAAATIQRQAITYGRLSETS